MVCSDEEMLERTGPLYDGLYEYWRRATMLGREPFVTGGVRRCGPLSAPNSRVSATAPSGFTPQGDLLFPREGERQRGGVSEPDRTCRTLEKLLI